MPRRWQTASISPWAAALAALALLAGCSSSGSSPRAARVTPAAPGEGLTVIADPDPAAAAVSASRALFDSAEVAVLARDGDAAGTFLAASAAVGLGVPLLLEPGDRGGGSALAAEAGRLGVRTVLAVGDADGAALGRRVDTVAVPAVPEAVRAATGLRFDGVRPVDADGAVAAVADLDPRHPAALAPRDAARTVARGEAPPRLPAVARPRPLDGVVALAQGRPADLAAVATVRAAGARVVPTAGRTDPRSSADAVAALSDGGTRSVLAVGEGFGAEPGLDWKVATAQAGTQLPGGGQTLFPGRLLVALYGTPGSPALGVLGEQGLDASIARARQHAAAFDDLVDEPVVPAFEIIATVASSAPGPDGDYSAESDPQALRPWIEAAGRAGLYVVLDLQPGRTDFLTQAAYQSLLELPNVGLALDPEWRLGPHEQHLAQIGSVGVDEVNGVVSWLADLTRARRLPQKLLVVHQFQPRMISGRERLDTSRGELAVLVHADGQGSQGDKQATWAALHRDLPAGPLYWGWKNFYDEDRPMLTPQQTVEQVAPTPDLITYQ